MKKVVLKSFLFVVPRTSNNWPFYYLELTEFPYLVLLKVFAMLSFNEVAFIWAKFSHCISYMNYFGCPTFHNSSDGRGWPSSLWLKAQCSDVKYKFQVPVLPCPRHKLGPLSPTSHRNILPTRLSAMLDVVCSQNNIKLLF